MNEINLSPTMSHIGLNRRRVKIYNIVHQRLSQSRQDPQLHSLDQRNIFAEREAVAGEVESKRGAHSPYTCDDEQSVQVNTRPQSPSIAQFLRQESISKDPVHPCCDLKKLRAPLILRDFPIANFRVGNKNKKVKTQPCNPKLLNEMSGQEIYQVDREYELPMKRSPRNLSTSADIPNSVKKTRLLPILRKDRHQSALDGNLLDKQQHFLYKQGLLSQIRYSKDLKSKAGNKYFEMSLKDRGKEQLRDSPFLYVFHKDINKIRNSRFINEIRNKYPNLGRKNYLNLKGRNCSTKINDYLENQEENLRKQQIFKPVLSELPNSNEALFYTSSN